MRAIPKARSGLYSLAKFLGDVQAVTSGSSSKVGRRIVRRAVGKTFGRIMRRI